MKNLKRVLSLGLASVMLVGMMVVGASAVDYKDFTDKDEIQHTEAVSTMNLLGVIAGKDTGAFDPAGTVTRAEMAKMITVALNGGKDPVLGVKSTPTFSDIKGHWAEKYIEYCASLNIIAGQGNGTFAPNATVTGSQAAKMMLVAMGYEAEVYKMIGADWEINTNREANDAGLFEELDSMDPSVGMSRDNAAQLIWNGVQARTLTKSPSQSITTGEITFNYNLNGPSILQNKFKVYTAIGQLTDVDEGALTIVDDKSWDNEETFAGASNPNQTGFTKVGTDYSAYLGQTVKVLYKANDNVVGVAPMGVNKVYDMAQSAVDTADNGTKIKFDGASYALANKTVTTSPATVVDNQVKVLTVGVASKDVTSSVATAGQLKAPVSFNNIRFIDNDNDGKIEYAVITEVVPAKVTYASSTEIIAEGVTYKKANDTVADDIEKNDYVTVTYNPFSAKREVVEVEKISADVTGYRTTNNGADHQYRLEDTWYIADNAISGVTAGDKADMVAVNGVIFFMEKTAGTSSLDDVVIVIDKDNTSTVISRQAVIMKADGTKMTVTMDLTSSGAADPVVGELYTYTTTDNGYKFKAVTANIGDYTFTNGDKAVSGSTTIDKVDGNNIADSATIFLYAGKKGTVITGKQLKAQAATGFAKTGTPVQGYFTGKVDGLTRVVMASIEVASDSSLDNIAGKAGSYAVIVDAAYQSSSDYITYKIWNGTEVVTVREKDTSVLAARAKKAVITYSEIDGDTIKDVSVVGFRASVQGKQGDSKVWLNGQTDGTHDYKITKDTVILYVDFSASAADEIGLAGGELRLADEVDHVYTENVIGYDANPQDKELELLVIDVKNNIGTTYAVGTLGSYTTVTAARKDGATGNVKAGTTVEFTLTNSAATAVTLKASYGGQEAVITVPGNGTATASFLQPAAVVNLTLAANS